ARRRHRRPALPRTLPEGGRRARWTRPRRPPGGPSLGLRAEHRGRRAAAAAAALPAAGAGAAGPSRSGAMSFIDPVWLPLLVLVPCLALVYVLLQRRRRTYALRFTNLDLLASVAGRRPGFRRHLPTALFLLGLGGLVLAAAHPVLNLEV